MSTSFGKKTPAPATSVMERLREAQARIQASAVSPETLEAVRLKALDNLDILDTRQEESFDLIVRMAKRVFATPINLISFIDGHRQWYKAQQGMAVTEVTRCETFCTRILDDG